MRQRQRACRERGLVATSSPIALLPIVRPSGFFKGFFKGFFSGVIVGLGLTVVFIFVWLLIQDE
jgi:hypothetical protein